MIVKGTNLRPRKVVDESGLSVVVVSGNDGTPLAIFIEHGSRQADEHVIMKTADDPEFASLLDMYGIKFENRVTRLVV